MNTLIDIRVTFGLFLSSMVNTVGSLTKEQKSILVGCLLGDGTMRKKVNAYLEINHAYSQKVLVDWLYEKFQNLVSTLPKWRKGNENREAYREYESFLDYFRKRIIKEL